MELGPQDLWFTGLLFTSLAAFGSEHFDSSLREEYSYMALTIGRYIGIAALSVSSFNVFPPIAVLTSVLAVSLVGYCVFGKLSWD